MASAEENQVAVPQVPDDDDEFDLSNSDVCTKYREAGRIANLALQGIKGQVKEGATIGSLCKFGDTVIAQLCSAIYQKKVNGKAIDKGVAFPTCVSVNEVVCHNCPLESDAEGLVALKAGDLVKVDLAVHIDGFIVAVADTLKCDAAPTPESPLAGEEGNLFRAAHFMQEVASKLVRPGRSNEEVTMAWEKIAESFGVSLVEGTLSHQMKRYVIDGNKVIIGKRDHTMKVDPVTFELNEVYCVDVGLSTGDGKCKQSETRTTVFKRAVDKSYRLKMKASRYLFNEVNNKFPTLPFTLRAFDDEKSARMGVVECQKHELVTPYPVLHEKEGAQVVHFKFTLLLLPSGTVRVTDQSVDPACYATDKEVCEETKAILAMSSKTNKKKKKKAKDTKAAE
mmetsp:Transcript_52224/g.119136  ORF Transcript_52224/g.119136 Transcript_52224/m.119136 type:complete len:395 (+) Transcript_52224:87-1271(+)